MKDNNKQLIISSSSMAQCPAVLDYKYFHAAHKYLSSGVDQPHCLPKFSSKGMSCWSWATVFICTPNAASEQAYDSVVRATAMQVAGSQ